MIYSEIKKRTKRKVEVTPCGIQYLDETLGGGFRNGSLVALLGREESGKTLFLEQILLSFLAQGKRSAYFALEFSDFELIDHMEKRIEAGIVSKKEIEKIEIFTSEEFSDGFHIVEEMEKLHQEKDISIFGIDSTMSLTAATSIEGEMQKIKELFLTLSDFAKKTKSIVFLITQKSKNSVEKKEASIYGSQRANHYANLILDFEVEDGKHTIEIAKNKQNGKKAKYDVALNSDTLFFEIKDGEMPKKATKTKKKKIKKHLLQKIWMSQNLMFL